MDGRTDGRTDGQTDGRTDGRRSKAFFIIQISDIIDPGDSRLKHIFPVTSLIILNLQNMQNFVTYV